MKYFYAEKSIGKIHDRILVKRLLNYVLPYWKNILWCVLLLIIISILDLLRPYLIKVSIDQFIKHKDISSINKISILYLFIIVFSLILNYLQAYLLGYTGSKIIYDIRQDMFIHLQRMSLSFFDKNPVGKLVTIITNDTETLHEMYTSVLVNLLKDFFMIIGVIVVMIRLSLRLTIVMLCVAPLVALGTAVFSKKVRVAYGLVRTKLSQINTNLNESITGIKTIKVFNKEDKTYFHFDNINKEYLMAAKEQLHLYALFHPGVEFLSSIALASILWIGGGAVIERNLEFGILYAFIHYIKIFFRPIADFSDKFNILQSAMASSERIIHFLDIKADIINNDSSISLMKLDGNIEFNHVWFAYNEKDWILKDICFKINPGETLAIVGTSGSGKSTIVNLLGRFYDIQKGEILIDGINIKNMNIHSLRSNIGTVLQDVFLFSGDIISNIRMNHEWISNEKIIEISKFINAYDFIQQLPGGYFCETTERGSTLSQGQRQLISFIRALAFDPSILVLDEATSNIDTEIETTIQHALSISLKNRTSIVIAHRLSTIQNADHIIVLHKGTIVESGTHQQLLEKKGPYYNFYQIQNE